MIKLNSYNYLKKYLFFVLESVVLVSLLLFFLTKDYEEREIAMSLKTIVESHYKAFFILVISWFFIGNNFKVNTYLKGKPLASTLSGFIYQVIIFSILFFAVSGLKSIDLLSVSNSLQFLGYFALSVFILRMVAFFSIKKLRTSGINSENILFIDQNNNTPSYLKLIQNRKDLGYHIIGQINGKSIDGLAIKNFSIDDFEQIIDKFKIHTLFISLEGELSSEMLQECKITAAKRRLNINFIPSQAMSLQNDYELDYFYTTPIFRSKENPLEFTLNILIKRVFDFVVSFLVLLSVSLILFPIISALILLDSGLPIFFKQKRAGLDGKEFYCYKFRTMQINKDSDSRITTRGDERITKIGNLLRKTSLDELPQLFNVLKGDMSLVGPRPHMISQDETYDELIQHYSLRHHVKPGITGLAQISGYRGEINSDVDMENRVRSDLYYIRNWTFSLDIIIMLKTLINMVKGDENAI